MKRCILALLAFAAALVVVAGCSLPQSQENVKASSKLLTPDQVKIAVVTHAAPGDQFWDFVRSGVDQAAKDDGVQVDYNSSPEPAQQSTLIDNAVASGANGIIVSMANPDALRAAIRRAVSKGIPVVTINSGIDDWKAFGAFTHIGQSESIAGTAAGEQLSKNGAKKAICVIHEAGNIGLEQRCAAAKKAFKGTMTNLQVNGTDTNGTAASITSKLRADKSIDAVLALQGQVATLAVGAKGSAGSKAQIATFDVDQNVLSAILGGRLAFAIDQQPYAQGYEGVAAMVLKLTRGITLGGGQPIYTGPTIVDKSNAQVTLDALKGEVG
ncbi:substrate-binding domain-containing protein [Flexivirga sp. ID2601S]|uniref:Substrate-binding domain-containing protein n=1 Tax=Flexivirga aerilata TaxID=1656889 RepID=A0A849AGB6_9MICO|nr:substrate-binding domain-containing protein [Flexivirga aerilata]NNG39505.1 substrate-binding domain-containing protein [Flexivirga aerilata]